MVEFPKSLGLVILVYMKMECGEKLVLRDVRFVPRMKINLISISKLDDEGYSCEFGSRQRKLMFGSQVMTVGHKYSTLYICRFDVAKRSERQWMSVKVVDDKYRGTTESAIMIANFDKSD